MIDELLDNSLMKLDIEPSLSTIKEYHACYGQIPCSQPIANHYYNLPVDEVFKVKILDLPKYTSTSIIESNDLNYYMSDNLILANLKNYELDCFGVKMPFAASDSNTPEGLYYVIEKWEYPYFKMNHNGMAFVPSQENPLGKYLIILADENGKKIPQSIHRWFPKPYSKTNFKQGDHSLGCIRLRDKDMDYMFNKIPLGSKIKMYR